MFTKLYKGSDVATILGISKALAYRLLSEGSIPSVRFGRSVRCRQEDLEDFIRKHLTSKDTSNSLLPDLSKEIKR
jgi:excisionase family DNA binding protein